MSAKSKTITDAAKRGVTHEELQVLVSHISALIAAHDIRLAECERCRPVDPAVKEAADEFVRANNHPGIALVTDREERISEQATVEQLPDGGAFVVEPFEPADAS